MKCSVLPVGRLRANCCVLSDGGGTAAVADPGGDIELIRSCLAQEGLTVKAILLTHGHPDHTGALKQLKEETGAPVYACPLDAGFLPVPVDVPVQDGDAVTVGKMTFSVIHTPGHTPGSVLYLIEDVMLSGDTLFRESIGRTDFPEGDPEAMEESLRKILELPQEDLTVVPGHGPFTTLDYEREFNPYLEALSF